MPINNNITSSTRNECTSIDVNQTEVVTINSNQITIAKRWTLLFSVYHCQMPSIRLFVCFHSVPVCLFYFVYLQRKTTFSPVVVNWITSTTAVNVRGQNVLMLRKGRKFSAFYLFLSFFCFLCTATDDSDVSEQLFFYFFLSSPHSNFPLWPWNRLTAWKAKTLQ